MNSVAYCIFDSEFKNAFKRLYLCNWEYLTGGLQMIWSVPIKYLVRAKSFGPHQIIQIIDWGAPYDLACTK